MTNDIREIKNKYLKSSQSSNSDNTEILRPGSLVIHINTGKQMRIRSVKPNGKYACFKDGGTTYEGDFDRSEIRLSN